MLSTKRYNPAKANAALAASIRPFAATAPQPVGAVDIPATPRVSGPTVANFRLKNKSAGPMVSCPHGVDNSTAAHAPDPLGALLDTRRGIRAAEGVVDAEPPKPRPVRAVECTAPANLTSRPEVDQKSVAAVSPLNNIPAAPVGSYPEIRDNSTCAKNAQVQRTATGQGTDTRRSYNITSTIPWDCELARLPRARNETREYVLLGYGHVAANGEGRITLDNLFTAASELGLTTNRRTFNAWIQKGMGTYWHKRGGYLYLVGWRKLSRKLTKWALKHRPELIATNLPGQQRVRLDLTGSLQSVHAKLYGGWITVKAAKNGYLDISRHVLTTLFSCSSRALLGYEKLLGIRVEERFAESANIHSPLIPAHAYLCLDTDGTTFASWQLSNRYYPPQIEIHPANGQRHKVRKAVNAFLDTHDPAVIRRGGGSRVKRIGRITFYGKRTKKGYVPAAKQLDRHLRKHGDVLERPHYVYLATRYGRRIYECTTDCCWRSADSERDRAGERTADFARRRMGYSVGWAVRMGV